MSSNEKDSELLALRELRAMLESIRLATERLKSDIEASCENYNTMQSKFFFMLRLIFYIRLE